MPFYALGFFFQHISLVLKLFFLLIKQVELLLQLLYSLLEHTHIVGVKGGSLRLRNDSSLVKGVLELLLLRFGQIYRLNLACQEFFVTDRIQHLRSCCVSHLRSTLVMNVDGRKVLAAKSLEVPSVFLCSSLLRHLFSKW